SVASRGYLRYCRWNPGAGLARQRLAEPRRERLAAHAEGLRIRATKSRAARRRGMAKDLRSANPEERLMDERTKNLIAECKRLEESCLYTSTTLFEWLKHLRIWKGAFVVAPITLGAVGTWPILKQQTGYEWVTAGCALLAGIAPAVYKALDF